MKCEFGVCIVCEKEIATKCPTCSKRSPSEDYTEVQLNWSNGSKMQTAACLDCSKEKVWKADKTELTHAIWDAWDRSNQSYDREVVIV